MNHVPESSVAQQHVSYSLSTAAKRPNLYRQLRILLACVVLPMLVLSVVTIVAVSRVTEERTAEGILQTTRGVVATTDAELKGYLGALRLLAESPSLRAADPQAFKADAERFLATFPGKNANVVLANAEGDILVSAQTIASAAPLKRADLSALRQVFATKRPHISNIYVGAISGIPQFTIDVPVIRNGEVVFDLSFIPSRDSFFQLVQVVDLPPGWIISIFDRNYRHVARDPFLGELTSAAESLQAEMKKSNEGIARTTSLEGVKLITAFTRSSETGWIAAIGVPAEHLSGIVNRTLTIAVTLSALFYLAAAAFAYRMTREVTRAENERELLINELNHRVKNTLSAVQAIVSQTLRRTIDRKEVRSAVQNRLLAMSRAHDALSERNWTNVDLDQLIRVILQGYDAAAMDRVRIAGPPLHLIPRRAIPLAMILNELATNALKHGALSTPAGQLIVAWRIIDPNTLQFDWEETGTTVTGPPETTGFGSFFVERAVAHELRGTIEHDYGMGRLKIRIQFSPEASKTP